MREVAGVRLPWCDPLAVLAGMADRPFTLALLSGGEGRWSYLLAEPIATLTIGAEDSRDPFAALRALLPSGERLSDGPPFQGGVAGLASYSLGGRVEPVNMARDPTWPDLACGLYDAVLAFDHQERTLWSIGRGADAGRAKARAERLASELAVAAPAFAAGTLADSWREMASGAAYEGAVADVVERIAAGEIFQANVSRGWTAKLRARVAPVDLLARLAGQSAAPFAGYLRLPGLALVSNSPERFLQVDGDGRVRAQPIKGTRPRSPDPARDAALAAELAASGKDRAENLMIVDLMRNDLARVCAPGSVSVPQLCAVRAFANVHHLVSTVGGALAPGRHACDLLRAAFPPGSITGAPKVQAMRVIERHDAPRGPYCGSLFWAGVDGAFDSSVLIRTAALVERAGGWDVTVRAGAGIVADSDPAEERRETETKISALKRALTEPA